MQFKQSSIFVFLSICLTFFSACATTGSSVGFHSNLGFNNFDIDYNFKNAIPIKSTRLITEDKSLPAKSSKNSLMPHVFADKISGFSHGSATGIVISHDGLILTNYHVVNRDPILIQVMVGEKNQIAAPATIVAEHTKNDLAVIKINHNFSNVAHFGSEKNIKINQTVYYWGYPFGLSRDSAGKCFHRGYISRLDVHIPFFSKADLPRFFMGIRGAPGVSGSGIYSEDGHIVGVMQGYVADGLHMVGIPVDQVTQFLRDNRIPYNE